MIQKHLDRNRDAVVLEYEVPVPPPRILTSDGDAEFQEGEINLLEAADSGAPQAEKEAGAKTGRTKTLRQRIRDEAQYPELNASEKSCQVATLAR
jgi:hypothetical protein